MKNNKNKVLGCLMLAGIVLVGTACGSSRPTRTVSSEYYGVKLPTTTAYTNYNALLGSVPAGFNYLTTSKADEAQHIGNFMVGLVGNDNYGRLVKNLATQVTGAQASNYREFVFTLRRNVPWVTWEGKQYTYGGANQYVAPQDFVTGLKQVITFENGSDVEYLGTMFVEGAAEYYCYTELMFYIANKAEWKMQYNTPEKRAAKLTLMIQEKLDTTITPITGAELSAIANFSRVGIKADAEAYTVKYILNSSAPFFPTMLTYNPFLPVNENFLREVGGVKSFGLSKETLLFNGPYLLNKSDDYGLTYKKNPLYYNTQEDVLETIDLILFPTGQSSNYGYAREQYEADKIDGFSLSSKDKQGWEKYVTGTGSTPGTIENPVNAYSRYYNTIDSTWYLSLNVNRDTEVEIKDQYSSLDSLQDIVNTNKALKIKEVRAAILDGIDFEQYNERHGDLEIEQKQVQLNTYIPKEFVFDDSNIDYFDYYVDEYADQKGITREEAAEIVEPGQYENSNLSFEEAKALGAEAKKAVDLYNSTVASTQEEKITYPIKVENASIAYDQSSLTEDNLWARRVNERINGCTLFNESVTSELPLCSGSDYPYLKIVNNTKLTSSSLIETAIYSGYYNICVWGWGPDYADPLTYLNTYTKGGDMAKYSGIKSDDDTSGYKLNSTGTSLVHEDSFLATLDSLVNEGRAQSASLTARFQKFAEAEYELLNNVHIIKPLYNNGQGWKVSVSRALGYDAPNSSYGLSSYRLTGLVILKEVVNGADRNTMRANFNKMKEAAIKETGIIAIY